jgi:hypothetical protein
MNTKKFVGLIVLLIGVVLVVFSIYAKGRISSAKGTVEKVTSPFSGSEGGKIAAREGNRMASQYDTKVQMILIGGIILVIVGGGIIFFGRKK